MMKRFLLAAWVLFATTVAAASFSSIMFPGPGAASKLSISYTDVGTFIANNASPSYNLSVGAADPTRFVMVAVYSNSGSSLFPTVSSVTINGIAATMFVTNNADYGGIARTTAHLYGLLVPTGTTATIQVNWSGTNSGHTTNIAVYRVTGSAATSLSTSATSDNTATPSASLAIPANGVAIGIMTNGNGGTMTWTNLSEDLDLNGGAGNFYTISTASSATAGTLTRSAVATAGTTSNAFTVAALKP